jgi:hypothetical protein
METLGSAREASTYCGRLPGSQGGCIQRPNPSPLGSVGGFCVLDAVCIR